MVHALIILSISRTCDLDIPYNFFHHLVAPSFEISVSRQRRIPAGFFNRDIMLHSTGVVNSNLCNRNHKISNLTVEHKGTHIIQCLPHNAVCSTACAMMWRQSVLSCLCIRSKWVTVSSNLLHCLVAPAFSSFARDMSRLYRSLEWYTRVYTTRDYGITYLFHDCRAKANMGLRLAGSTGHASVEWVMGRYFTPDTVLRDRRQK